MFWEVKINIWSKYHRIMICTMLERDQKDHLVKHFESFFSCKSPGSQVFVKICFLTDPLTWITGGKRLLFSRCCEMMWGEPQLSPTLGTFSLRGPRQLLHIWLLLRLDLVAAKDPRWRFRQISPSPSPDCSSPWRCEDRWRFLCVCSRCFVFLRPKGRRREEDQLSRCALLRGVLLLHSYGLSPPALPRSELVPFHPAGSCAS